ncbi:hypothetical protein CK203_022193 [Vitis vinifera]|uniref:FAM91 N-terminal domain-containing protein n=1 Tax=Vitis vinifera TaxID=29760 RepID=A0A438FZK3_VITVI|nr:hypothetical protein CK203_022193 [Vitis vinifera]
MWKLNKSIAKELLPTQPVDFAIEPWWGVCLVNFTLEEFKKLSEEEMVTIDKVCKEEANSFVLFDPDVVKGLFRRGLIYFDVPVYPDDRFKGLKVNLDKSELILVGNVEELVAKRGCKVGSLPSTYLGMPLDAPFKFVVAWDKVKERFGLWKAIKKLEHIVSSRLSFVVGNSQRDVWNGSIGVGSWSPRFTRSFNDWEMDEVEDLLLCLCGQKVILEEEDRVWWMKTKDEFSRQSHFTKP